MVRGFWSLYAARAERVLGMEALARYDLSGPGGFYWGPMDPQPDITGRVIERALQVQSSSAVHVRQASQDGEQMGEAHQIDQSVA